jgi:thiosulfate dehydrogenase
MKYHLSAVLLVSLMRSAAFGQDFQAELPGPGAGTKEFSPPDYDDMPEGPFGEAVRRGQQIFSDTGTYAREFTGNALSCSNCHLDDGRKKDSGPMWAAWISYPAYRKKNDRTNTMEERIIGCFTYSMNAQASPAKKAPPPGHDILTDLQAYMFWTAQGAPVGGHLKGRGYPELKRPVAGTDAMKGATIYQAKCAVCHGVDGQGRMQEGKYVFPPLWGDQSFNWGAGMHRVNTAAGFIYANMPLGQGFSLTEQEAWDVADFMTAKPRPKDPRVRGPSDLVKFHDEDCHLHDSSPVK